MRRSFVYVVLFGAVALAIGACARTGSDRAASTEPRSAGQETLLPRGAALSARGLPLGDLTIASGPATSPGPAQADGSATPATPGDALAPVGPGAPREPASGAGSLHLTVEIADTPEASERGLMGVEHLSDDQGMAFLWDDPSTVAFWMKDTLVPLDIAFWDEKGRIFDIQQMQPCRVPSGQSAEAVCPLYHPSGPYVGALEVNLGLLERNGVRPGATVELTRR